MNLNEVLESPKKSYLILLFAVPFRSFTRPRAALASAVAQGGTANSFDKKLFKPILNTLQEE